VALETRTLEPPSNTAISVTITTSAHAHHSQEVNELNLSCYIVSRRVVHQLAQLAFQETCAQQADCTRDKEGRNERALVVFGVIVGHEQSTSTSLQ
jgi:hypothetical protein